MGDGNGMCAFLEGTKGGDLGLLVLTRPAKMLGSFFLARDQRKIERRGKFLNRKERKVHRTICSRLQLMFNTTAAAAKINGLGECRAGG